MTKQTKNTAGTKPEHPMEEYPVIVHIPEKNPAQEDDDLIRMARMLKKLMHSRKSSE